MTKTPEELTEEWKAGKLEYGWYWIKHKKRGTIPDRYIPGDDWFVSNGFCITKILAPCKYDEYKAMQERIADASKTIKELESAHWYQTVQNEDIGKLRGLLKECTEYLSDVDEYRTKNADEAYLLLTCINAALSESDK